MSQFLTSNELFINIKNPPKWNPRKNFFDQQIDVIDFYLEEKRKITEGITIGGYRIHPWLYWHLNFFKTPIPTEDGKELIMNPPLDDNMLFVMENYEEAEAKGLGLMLFGCRGFTKSSMLASLITWLNSTKANGTTSVMGGNDGDLKAISTLLKVGFNNVSPAMYIPQLIQEWDNKVELGIKEKDGFRIPHSHISITNGSGGTDNSSEKGAGLSPVGFILDEALHEDSLIYYDGFEKPIKDVKVGDQIYGDDGKLTKILDKINPGVVDTYSITLSDGRSVIASDNHIWKVYNTSKSCWQELTTEEIRKKYYYEKIDKRYNKVSKSLIYSLPINEPISYSKKDLKIDPYWLGLYLGDGFIGTSSICSIDKEILDYCESYAESLGMKCSRIHPNSTPNPDFYISRIVTNIGQRGYNLNPLIDRLREYKLDILKNIPNDYLYSSIEDRLSLLQGLMDTDGSVSKNGHIEFSTSIPELAKSFEILCRGLGISLKHSIKKTSYTKNGKKVVCKDAYRFRLYTDLPIFRLNRKLANYNLVEGNNNSKKKLAYKTRITISDIKYVGKNQVYCIKVDNQSNLFLTENYIVTHNCGKWGFKKVLQSALPSFKTQYGMKLVPILSGTSGNQDLSKDAKDVLSNPEAYDMLPMNWDTLDRKVDPEFITWERSKKESFCTFVPGQMSYRLPVPKKAINLAEYLDIENGDLEKIKVNATDWEKASTFIKDKNNAFKKEEDRERNRMYFPLEIADVFITASSNPFPTAVIDKHIRKLEDEGILGKSVNIYKHNGEYKQEFSSKKLAEVSHGGGEADAPILLFGELPETQPHKYTYVSGLDDYKLDQSDTDSLGAFYVLKRRNLEMNSPCETIAASYVARPFRHSDFHKTGETLIEAFHAICMMEAVDVSFKQFLDTKYKSEQLLAPSISFSNSSQNGNAKLNSKFGIYPTGGNKAYMFNMLIDYCKEEHVIGIDEDGNEIIKYGVEYILDIALLKEMLSYRKGGNFDRITAFMHSLAYARELDKNNVRPAEKRKTTEYNNISGPKKVGLSVFGSRRPSAF
jgi:hypothetical protein